MPATAQAPAEKKGVSLIGLTTGPSLPPSKTKRKRRKTEYGSSSEEDDDEELDASVTPTEIPSIILDTARLRARREANIAAFKAKRGLAPAITTSTIEDLDMSAKLPSLPDIASQAWISATAGGGFSDGPAVGVGFSDAPSPTASAAAAAQNAIPSSTAELVAMLTGNVSIR